jgi:predicted flap endonuclease-1-like 5' DNA nuclease
MKKIGILFGQENTFPWAFIERINEKKIPGVIAEAVSIDKVIQGDASEYAVIVDRISQDVPFYRAFLKNAAISGTAVINNPFWWSADEKFFNNALAVKIGVPVPNTVILPSKVMPDDTSANSFRNLKYPLDWEGIFKYIGFPAYMKPHDGGGWKSVYKIHNMEDFFDKYAETGQLVMMLQSEVIFEQYFRCYCLGGKYVHIMPYEPRNPHHLRYETGIETSPEMLATVEKYVLMLNHALGYDFNTVEFGVMNGIPYAIDFCNPAPDAELTSVGKTNFDWIVENSANYAIERALAHKDGQDNLTWGTYIKYANGNGSLIPTLAKGSGQKSITTSKVAVSIPKTEVSASKVEIVPSSVTPTPKMDYKVVKTTTTINPVNPEDFAVETTYTSAKIISTDKSATKSVEKAVTNEIISPIKVEKATAKTVKVAKAVEKAAVKTVKVAKAEKPAKIAKTVEKAAVKTVKVAKAEKPAKIAKTVEKAAVKTVKVAKAEKPAKIPKTVEKTTVKVAKIEKPAKIVKTVEKTVPVKVKETKVEKSIGKAVSTEGVSVKDDLKRIEGIGPKIEELLNAAGIQTFKQLSATKAGNVKSILDAAGKRFQMHDPTTWPKQAKLASEGKWEALDKLQGELNGGK